LLPLELRRRATLPALARDCADDGLDATQPIRIDGVAEGSTIARAPNSSAPATLHLRALGASGDVLWLINGRLSGTTRGSAPFVHAFEETGLQAITALAASGAYAQLQVRVLR
jgi:penicillin-binding protein 1C